jgi:hypothetical protein
MNLIHKITSTKEKTLNIYLDDSFITVHHLGIYENIKWYTWSSWGPTEGLFPDYDSHLVTEEKIIERLSLLSDLKDNQKFNPEEIHAINLFFGKVIL